MGGSCRAYHIWVRRTRRVCIPAYDIILLAGIVKRYEIYNEIHGMCSLRSLFTHKRMTDDPPRRLGWCRVQQPAVVCGCLRAGDVVVVVVGGLQPAGHNDNIYSRGGGVKSSAKRGIGY